MQSKSTTVAEYLASLPADRRAALEAVRKVIRDNMDGYAEGMAYGMIGYSVPLSTFPAGYHCSPGQPLPFACLGSQKGHMSLHLMGLYMSGANGELVRWFQGAWKKTGKKLDMGKACIRFKKLDDLALDVLAQAIRKMPAKKYIAVYEGLLATSKTGAKKLAASKAKAGGKAVVAATSRAATTRKPAARKPAPKRAAAR